MEDITQTLINEEYGGVHYGTIILDLTEQKVKSFSLNQSQGHSITGTFNHRDIQSQGHSITGTGF
jgi:hypothetical protein